MLMIKVNKKNLKEDTVNKTFGIIILSYIKNLFKNEKINIINDSKTLELIASDISEENEDKSTIELTITTTRKSL